MTIKEKVLQLLDNKKIIAVWIIVAFCLGFLIRGGSEQSTPSQKSTPQTAQDTATVTQWTCSMHPQIRRPKPGLCPICAMDLIPVTGSDEDGNGRQIKFSPAAIKLASISVAPVERKYVVHEVRMVGKIEVDESRIATISAWVPGRIERLYIDYTGKIVRKKDHMVSIYSPELLTAQQELLQTLTSYRRGAALVKKAALRRLTAAREKLRLMGLTQRQIKDIENKGQLTETMTIYAPIGGIVLTKHAVEGMYVKTGSPIYTIADLSEVWVKLDAYESDLPWLRYGQEVEFETESYPGEGFTGKIVFIDPVINPKIRTVKVRVNIPNHEGKLKPEMFVRAKVYSKLGVSGKVMDPDFVGKWICPMHPKVIKDE